MKLSYLVLSLSLVGAGSVASAANFSNIGCTKKWYSDFGGLIHQVSLFPGDNRGLIAVRGPEEGLTAHDIQQAEQNLVTILCPSRVPGKFHATGASFVGSNSQLLTNKHAFQNEDGSINDPLSKCIFMQLALRDKRRLIEHPLNLKDGVEGLKQLQAMGVIKLGAFPKDLRDDYAVLKLNAPVSFVKPYQLGELPVKPHGCKENQLCQRVITISQSQERMKPEMKNGPLVLQSSDLRGVLAARDGAESFFTSDTSSTDGASGSLQFLKDDNGQLIRGSDGELLPFAILSGSKNQSFDGHAYSSKDNVYTLSVGLDGKVLDDIQTIAGKTQTAENPGDPNLPTNNDGI